jgi:hypothetical protein
MSYYLNSSIGGDTVFKEGHEQIKVKLRHTLSGSKKIIHLLWLIKKKTLRFYPVLLVIC